MMHRLTLLSLILFMALACPAVAVEEELTPPAAPPVLEVNPDSEPVFGPKMSAEEFEKFDQQRPKVDTPAKKRPFEIPEVAPPVLEAPPSPEVTPGSGTEAAESVPTEDPASKSTTEPQDEAVEGAAPDDQTTAVEESIPTEAAVPIEATSGSAGLSIFGYKLPYPNLHPFVVHFPIALLLLTPIVMLFGLLFYSEGTQDSAMALAVLGFAFALLATEVIHPATIQLPDAAQLALTRHDRYAHFTVLFSGAGILFGGLRWLLRPLRRSFSILALCAFLLAALCVGMTAHFGLELVHGHGVGVQGQFLQP